MFGKSDATDTDIIEGLRGDAATRKKFEYLLYRKFAYLVPSRPGKYRLDEDEARDAYTDSFLAVVDNITSGKFRGEASLKTYISRIFRNKCVDRFRKNSTVKVEWLDEFPDISDPSKDFLRKIMGREEMNGLLQWLKQLGERCQELLMLSGQGYSPSEIAEQMDFKTPRSASSQRYKCLEKLKTLIKKAQTSSTNV
ncbi:MAG: sigma-70 family RNA polymerase sigma factor [Bacteroidia bacterium]|nr:sigma-70 family RNA polymerase sigma factor [Bacteroidia bacterium]